MRTLGKEITKTFFETEDGYQRLKKYWSNLMQDHKARKSIKAEHHLLYLALIGKDWTKGFTSPINKNKINNGYRSSSRTTPDKAFSIWRYWWNKPSVFDGIIDENSIKKLKQYIRDEGYERKETDEPYSTIIDRKIYRLQREILYDEQYIANSQNRIDKFVEQENLQIAYRQKQIDLLKQEIEEIISAE